MRVLPFLIFAYLFVAVQFALGGALRWGAWTPNLVLLFVTFIGLHASVEAALVGGLVLGLMHDVVASHGMGTLAFAYPLLAYLAFKLRGVMYRDHALTQATIALLLGTLLAVYLAARQWLRSVYLTSDLPGPSLGSGLRGMLTTAVLAIPVIWLLRRLRRTFGFTSRDAS